MSESCPSCGSENTAEVYCETCGGKGFDESILYIVPFEDCPDCSGWGVPCTGEMECLDCEHTWGKVEVESVGVT